MGGIAPGTVMDALATAFSTVDGVTRAFAYPREDPSPGTAIVGYPDGDISLSITFGRGADRGTFVVWVVCGLVQDLATRDVVDTVLSDGAVDVLQALNATSLTIPTVRARFERLDIGGLQHLAIRFDIEVVA